jgi:hypothetical protein
MVTTGPLVLLTALWKACWRIILPLSLPLLDQQPTAPLLDNDAKHATNNKYGNYTARKCLFVIVIIQVRITKQTCNALYHLSHYNVPDGHRSNN